MSVNKGDSVSEKRKLALERALAGINKKYGNENTVMKLGQQPKGNVEVIPSGSLAIDIALGIGGLPKGRIVEIYGPESSGKTTLALSAIASAHKQGKTVAFIDAEHALDPVYARKLGVDVDELIFNQPDNGEQALEIVENLVASGGVDLIVVDSVAALVPKAELEGQMGDSHMALQARLMSQALRKITSQANENGCTIIFINQLRDKIGVFFGSPETTTGGKALKFYASVRIDIRRIGALKDGQEIVGNQTKVKIVKNKMAPPFKEAEVDLMYGEGFSFEGDIIDLGVKLNLIKKSGSWFSYGPDQLGQGKENTRTFLKKNLEVRQELEDKIRAAFFKEEEEGVEADGDVESESNDLDTE